MTLNLRTARDARTNDVAVIDVATLDDDALDDADLDRVRILHRRDAGDKIVFTVVSINYSRARAYDVDLAADAPIALDDDA